MPRAVAPTRSPSDLLRAAGLRVTPMRLAVLEILANPPPPHQALQAQQIIDALAAARSPRSRKPDRVTIYRTLNALVESGLAHKVDPGDRLFRFSLTDHAHCTPTHHKHDHPHFVCDACGGVECLEDAEVIVKAAPAPARAKARGPRRVTQQEVLLRGTCERCTDEEDSAA